jgi:hypothetical protein
MKNLESWEVIIIIGMIIFMGTFAHFCFQVSGLPF